MMQGMVWLTALISAAAGLTGVVLGGRLTAGSEHKQWLRNERIKQCVALISEVEDFISNEDSRRTAMDKTVGTLIILGPSELAGAAGTLVHQATILQEALFKGNGGDYGAFRRYEWAFRAAAAKALKVRQSVSMEEVDAAAAQSASGP
jgi:hypothetical protein